MSDLRPRVSQPMAGLDHCLTQMAQLSGEKLAHFQQLLQALLDCYTTEQSRALVLVSKAPADGESISLLAVNADQAQTRELIDALCVFRQMDFGEPNTIN